MTTWEKIWARRESFSAHFAWGGLVAIYVKHAGGTGLEMILIPTAAGVVLEVGGEVVTRGLDRGRGCKHEGSGAVWKARAIDVVPWSVGALAAMVFL